MSCRSAQSEQNGRHLWQLGVTQLEGAVQSERYILCRHDSLKVEFLSGGRSRRMKELPEKEILAQLEKAYARATVAPLTKIRQLHLMVVDLDRSRSVSASHTPPLPLPFQWPGLSLWQVPPYFLSIISPPSAHPHGPACHCGRSRLATNIPNPLPSHLYTQPSVIPTFKARLVIVAGPAKWRDRATPLEGDLRPHSQRMCLSHGLPNGVCHGGHSESQST